MKVLVSAGEESGDRYAAELVEALKRRWEHAEFFGCAGPRLRAAGVRPVVEAERLSVVGLVEVIKHVPGIRRAFQKIVAAAERERPDLVILTDSPDFHLRLARELTSLGAPVIQLVAPQVWAWRGWRARAMRRVLAHVLCIFPFEEAFFRERGMAATYIGHPLAGGIRPALSKREFFRKHRLPAERPLIAVLPGSRRGEAARHLPVLVEAARRLNGWRAMSFLLAASRSTGEAFFTSRLAGSSLQVVEGETAEALAHADAALVASGTATIEAALAGTPMVTFYRVHAATWILGKWFVDVPFFSMVNLIAGRKVIPELIQSECTAERLAAEMRTLLEDPARMERMRNELVEVGGRLVAGEPVMERAADIIEQVLEAAGKPVRGRATSEKEVRTL